VTHRKTEKERQLADGRGRGDVMWEEPKILRRGENLVLYKPFNTLCRSSPNIPGYGCTVDFSCAGGKNSGLGPRLERYVSFPEAQTVTYTL